MQKILVIGATSAIAQACIQQWAQQGHQLHLVSRDQRKLQTLCDDIKIRAQKPCSFDTWDAQDFDTYGNCIQNAIKELGTIDICLIAHGNLPDQAETEQSAEKILDAIKINTLSVLNLITLITQQMQRQNFGTIAVITSVAGDRARKKNYIYGTAKAAVSKFLEGLRHRLANSPIKIIDIKPGVVDTPMTATMKKGLLCAQPEKVAKDIIIGIAKNKAVIYTPFFWSYIMLVIKLMPRKIFHKLNF